MIFQTAIRDSAHVGGLRCNGYCVTGAESERKWFVLCILLAVSES